MKTRTWVLIIGIVLAVCLGLSVFLLSPKEASTHAEIISDGAWIKTVDLRIDQEFTVTSSSGGTNLVTIRDGAIAVTEASCPDHYCMKRGFCVSGTDIVCLPNRLVIRFLGSQEIDAMIG